MAGACFPTTGCVRRPPLARASSNRLDALTLNGNEPGSDPVFMKTEHLDKYG